MERGEGSGEWGRRLGEGEGERKGERKGKGKGEGGGGGGGGSQIYAEEKIQSITAELSRMFYHLNMTHS